MSRAGHIPVLLLALAPLPLSAEGAQMRLACQVLSRCDGAGACAPGGGAVAFTLSPEGTDARGAGPYTLTRDGQAHPARAATGRGPFDWDENGQRQSLYVSDENRLIWIAQGAQGATVQFLNCKEG